MASEKKGSVPTAVIYISKDGKVTASSYPQRRWSNPPQSPMGSSPPSSPSFMGQQQASSYSQSMFNGPSSPAGLAPPSQNWSRVRRDSLKNNLNDFATLE